MTSLKMMIRGSAAIVALAAAILVQGCTMAQTGVSADGDYAAALDNVMTTDQSGE